MTPSEILHLRKNPESGANNHANRTWQNTYFRAAAYAGKLPSQDPARPYVDYTVDAALFVLSSYELPPRRWRKNTFTKSRLRRVGLGLAHRQAWTTEVVVTRICDPLGMKSTRITLSEL